MTRPYSRILLSACAGAFLLLSGCDITDFGDMNRDPNAASEASPDLLFTSSQLDAVSENYVGGGYLTIGQAMQHFATYKEVPAAGDKYFNDGYSRGHWNLYDDAYQSLHRVMQAVAEQPEDVNRRSVARIWQVYIFSRLTDLYGDIPYTEAGQALTESNYTPVYDEQAFVYSDMLTELEEAAQALDPSQPTFGSADLIYGGDVEQWRKFAYSMMLRLGMRLTEVDASAAQEWVQKAIAGGVVLEDDDVASIAYTDGGQEHNRNFIANGLREIDYLNPQDVDNIEGGKLAKTFIDHLKRTGDPRLNVLSVVWVESETGERVPDTTAALQKGMPNAAFNKIPGNFETFSEPHPNTVLSFSAPYLVLTNAEMHLLRAEAALRGWHQGSAADEYEQAVRAGMRQWARFGSDGEIPTAKIDRYLRENPYRSSGTFEEQLEQIQTQLWVSLHVEDPYEIYAHWRRTGYPELTPTDYTGNLTGGTIPTRFVVPESEGLYNAENFQAARDRQGGNAFTTTVWWDVE